MPLYICALLLFPEFYGLPALLRPCLTPNGSITYLSCFVAYMDFSCLWELWPQKRLELCHGGKKKQMKPTEFVKRMVKMLQVILEQLIKAIRCSTVIDRKPNNVQQLQKTKQMQKWFENVVKVTVFLVKLTNMNYVTSYKNDS